MKALLFVGTLLAALLLAACSSSEKASPLEKVGLLAVGDAAPPFTLPGADGRRVSLADYAGQKPVLVFFHMAFG